MKMNEEIILMLTFVFVIVIVAFIVLKLGEISSYDFSSDNLCCIFAMSKLL
jgi:hypothetical protein